MLKFDKVSRFLQDHPDSTTADIQLATGVSARHARRCRAKFERGYPLRFVSKEEEALHKSKIMAGLQKPQLPQKYREMIGDLVANVELALERQPDIPIEGDKDKEAAVLCLSDFHAGKQAYDDNGKCLFNKDIFAFRLALLRKRALKLLTYNLKQSTIDQVYLMLLGDLVDGSGIYAGQEINQDMSSVSDQISLVVAGVWQIVKDLRKAGFDVSIEGVRGNHGRQGKYTPSSNNFDLICYQLLYLLAHYEDQYVSVNYSTTTPYRNVMIKGHTVHMRHQAPPQTETPAARARYGGWREIHNFDVLLCGHLHHPGGGSYAGRDCLMNGSLVGLDDLAEELAYKARPSQRLFGLSKGNGISFSYNLWLDRFGEGGEAAELLRRYPMLKC